MDKYESFGTSSYSVGNCGDRSMELRDLYALSAENSAKYADNEAGNSRSFVSLRRPVVIQKQKFK